jgi:hypothetical protein
MGADAHRAAAGASHADTHSLGVSLGPVLLAHCEGRLTHLEWFRSTWQHGGAATAFARWRADDGSETDVLVKLPVGPVERRWSSQLSEAAESAPLNGLSHLGALALPTPRIMASGDSLGDYDLAWLVMERLDGHTLTHGWCRESLEDLIHAAAVMQAHAARLAPVGIRPPPPDWDALLLRAREIARQSAVPEAQHWKEDVKKVQRLLPRIAAKWDARPIDSWCHGDLHPGNAMRRRLPDSMPGEARPTRPPCVLIDLALVHAGNWVEDAVYLERQFWGHPEGLFGVHPVSLLAKYRRELGLPTDGDYGYLANLRRVLMAACAPVYLAHDGNPRYLHAALETLDRLLPQVAH